MWTHTNSVMETRVRVRLAGKFQGGIIVLILAANAMLHPPTHPTPPPESMNEVVQEDNFLQLQICSRNDRQVSWPFDTYACIHT